MSERGRKQRCVWKVDPDSLAILEEYPSIAKAAESVKGSKSGVRFCCDGDRRLHKGYSWEWVVELPDEEELLMIE